MIGTVARLLIALPIVAVIVAVVFGAGYLSLNQLNAGTNTSIVSAQFLTAFQTAESLAGTAIILLAVFTIIFVIIGMARGTGVGI